METQVNNPGETPPGGTKEAPAKIGAAEGMKCPMCGKTNYTNSLNRFFECFECEGGFQAPERLQVMVKALEHTGTWAAENKGMTFSKWDQGELEHKARVAHRILVGYNAWHGRGDVLEGPAGRVLEVGFGNGAMLAEFQVRNWTAVGIDRSLEAVEAGARNGLKVVKQMRIDQDPLPWGGFDLVYAWDSLEHVEDVAKAFRNIAGTLAPGGIFVMHSPDFKKYHMEKAHPYWEESHLWHMTARTAGYLANAAGIRTLKQEWGTLWGDRGLANKDNFVFWGAR